MSTLFVNNLNTASGSTITIPTGKTLVGTDEGSFRVPGTVLQVVQGERTAWTPTTSTTFVSTSNQATITPKSTSSKILIVATFNGVYADDAANMIIVSLYRTIGIGSASSIKSVTTNHMHNYGTRQAGQQYSTALCHQHYDTPNTTSAVLYSYYMRSRDGGTVGINNYGSEGDNTSSCSVSLMEIAQ